MRAIRILFPWKKSSGDAVKKTRRKHVLRSIRGNLNRYFSILFIVALGAGFMSGLFATAPDMYETADGYMDSNAFYDINVKSTAGLTDSDKEAILAMEGVLSLEGARVLDLVLENAMHTAYTTRVFGMLDENGTSAMNRLTLKEGRLPTAKGECVIELVGGRYSENTPHCGDVLTLSPDNRNYGTLQGYLAEERLTVVGIVQSPFCISIDGEPTNVGKGTIALNAYTAKDFFTFDFDTDLFLTVKGAKETDSFSTAYTALLSPVCEEIRRFEKEDPNVGFRVKLAELTAKEEKATSLLSLVKEPGDLLSENEAERRMQIKRYLPLLGDEALAGTVASRIDALGPEEDVLLLIETLLTEAITQMETAKESLIGASFLIRTREDNVGFSGYKANIGKVAALSRIFPVFFFLVALLVALTTMTRLVEENRPQIGTLKSLGFSDRQILSEYLFFSLSASLFGCILGFAVGFRLFPVAISSAYSMMYTLPPVQPPFRVSIALAVAPITVGSILFATLWACHGECRSCPAALLTPKAPAPGKRIFLEKIPALWAKFSFSLKVTCRNLFRYKKRLFMTIIGVAGCSALLLTGFGLRDSIHDIVDKQFGEIDHYGLTLLTKEESVTPGSELDVLLQDESKITASLRFSSRDGKVSFGGHTATAALSVPEDATQFSRFISLRERKSGKSLTLSEGGVILTEKLCEATGIRVGDTVNLENATGQKGETVVLGIAENYVTSYAYLTYETYLSVFGEAPEMTALLCLVPEGSDVAETAAIALSTEGVAYARTVQSIKDNFADSVKSIDAVVLVLILSAGLLCMVVLYNLINVNICERRKELATVRVLGFYEKETERYIFRETDALSMIGAILGLFIGSGLHAFVVRTVEIDQIMFGRSVYPLSYLYAIAITFLFTLFIDFLMKKQIKAIDMVEALKSTD